MTRPRRSGLIWIGIAVAVVLIALWAAAGLDLGRAAAQARPREVTPRGPLVASEQATIDLFEKARGSVVRVRLSDGRDAAAALVGVSPAHDLAVLRIDVSNPPPALPVGTSSNLRVGQSALAIGNPFGLDWTLTTGIVSAIDRALPTGDGGGLIENLIQTDAAVNPGNSGGPLLDSAGRLIGVNTMIFSPSGASAGVGFAVPVDTVNRVVPQLIATGKYVRPTLGIQVDERLNQLVTERLRVRGVAVLRVTPGSPAEAAGLRGAQAQENGAIIPGDVILEVDGTAVDSVARLLNRLDEHKVGDTVRLTLLRDGQKTTVSVTLGAGNQ
jgi:S1-C subfamily serine protease